MFKADIDLVATLKASLVEIPNVFLAYLWAVLALAVIAVVVFFITERGKQRISLRKALNYAFPRELYRQPSSRVDLFNFLLQIALWGPLVALISSVIIGLNVRELLIAFLGEREPLLHSTWAIVPAQFAVVVLSGELAFYVNHYCFHKIPWLWSLHRAHHSAEALTFLTERRAHPLDFFFGIFISGPVGGVSLGVALYLLGAPLSPATTVATGAFYGTIFPLVGLLNHSHVWISLGKLNYVLTGPVMHQLHHSAELRHRDKNLGGLLMIYDWMFGTIYVPKERESYRWGLNDREIGQTNPHNRLRDFYLEPVRHAWMTLTKRRKTLLQRDHRASDVVFPKRRRRD